MNRYTRKQINQKAQLHDKEFVILEDAGEAMSLLAEFAVKHGADESKLMEFLTGGWDD